MTRARSLTFCRQARGSIACRRLVSRGSRRGRGAGRRNGGFFVAPVLGGASEEESRPNFRVALPAGLFEERSASSNHRKIEKGQTLSCSVALSFPVDRSVAAAVVTGSREELLSATTLVVVFSAASPEAPTRC